MFPLQNVGCKELLYLNVSADKLYSCAEEAAQTNAMLECSALSIHNSIA